MPNDTFPYDVFLSHSAKDKAVVRDVAERLRKDGLRVWFDEWEIRPGDSIERTQSKTAKIEEGLERSRVLVLCMSAQAFGSDWAQLESGTFRFRDPLNKERRFLPLRLDDAPIIGSLAQFLYIKMTPTRNRRPTRAKRGSRKQLALALRSTPPIRAQPTVPYLPYGRGPQAQASAHERGRVVGHAQNCQSCLSSRRQRLQVELVITYRDLRSTDSCSSTLSDLIRLF